MTHQETIEYFFSYSIEKTFNEALLNDRNYVIPHVDMLYYVENILSVPYSEFINKIGENLSKLHISSKNITQCSSFTACEIEMCKVLINEDNPGLSFLEIGKLFPNYVTKNNENALRKFGENQIKTAAQLGLVFEYYDCWYLSCLGYIYQDLSEEQRKSVLARTLLRDPLYARITYDLTRGDVNILSYMTSIPSSQTKSRRYSNVEKLETICLNECLKEGITIGKILKTKTDIQDTEGDGKIIAGKTHLLEHTVDYSLFKNGFTIPISEHSLWKTYFDISQNIWTKKKNINVIVDKKPFKAVLNGSTNLLRQKQILQVQYTNDSAIAKYFRQVFHVSYDYIQQVPKQSWLDGIKDVQIPKDLEEHITVLAANRNDTIYITTESIDKKESFSIPTPLHQGVKDIEYYMGCFRDISISNDGHKVIISKLCMLLSLVEYIKWLKTFNEEQNSELPVLGVWEGMYIKIFQKYHNAKRTSTLFSTPFILLSEEPFWKLVNDEGMANMPTTGKYAVMTFANVQATFKSVIIDNELYDLILDTESCATLSDYLLKLLKKCSK